MKVITWSTDTTRKEVQKRFKNASEARKSLEDSWLRNESTLYSIRGNVGPGTSSMTSLQNVFQYGMPGIDGSDANMNIAYTFKNIRYIHAQMSANPPSVAMRPATSDQEDHRRADAADRIARWAIRHYTMQEKVDQLSLNCLVYGTGLIKAVWDSTKGDIIKFDPETDEIELEGDISVTNPHTWNIFLDPDAKSWDECKWVIERIYMDYEEACSRWPERKDELKKAKVERTGGASESTGRASYTDDVHYNSVELLEYWETGLPTNGYMGRYCITTTDGSVIEPCRPSPHRFKRAGAASSIEKEDIPDEVKEMRIAQLPEMACLPYALLTDIDVPNYLWGRSSVEYASLIQENLNRLDSSVLDNIQAHGVARMIVPESAEINDDALSNSPWDVVKMTGNQPPYYMSPPQLMPDMTNSRQNYIEGIDQVMGVNEAMFGQQSREQSGASMQYATNQGNMVRRRLFNKYVLAVESIYKNILNLARKHWSMGRTISVLGKEKALEAVDIKGADIDGGFDIVAEYGVTLSLDPVTRREEILTMQPLFEKAGVPVRSTMKMLKLNELEGMFDRLDLAENRQKEIFDEMVATNRYIAPEDLMDHENMIAWALDYFMTQEFTVLAPETKSLLKQHIRDRGKLAASEKTGGSAPQQAAAPANAAPGPVPSQPAGQLPEPTTPQPGPVNA